MEVIMRTIQVQCLDKEEQLYLIDHQGWVDIYLRHMLNDEEDEANMTVSIKLEELENAIDEFKKR